MKAYAIVIKDHRVSESGYKELLRSSNEARNNFTIEKFNAITPDVVDDLILSLGIQWTWPHNCSEKYYLNQCLVLSKVTKHISCLYIPTVPVTQLKIVVSCQ